MMHDTDERQIDSRVETLRDKRWQLTRFISHFGSRIEALLCIDTGTSNIDILINTLIIQR